MTVNVLVTFTAVIATMAVGFVLTAPEFAVVPIVVAAVSVGVVVPVVVYPVSQTLWLAIDLAMRTPDDDELADWALASVVQPEERRARSRSR